MGTSSADIFEQYLRTGVGAKPIIAGYESQVLEFALENTEIWNSVKEDIVIIYPEPTIWSTHVYIALNEKGLKGIDALMRDDVQRLAWEKHGYRTSVYKKGSDNSKFGVSGVADDITMVMPMPDVNTMHKIINSLK